MARMDAEGEIAGVLTAFPAGNPSKDHLRSEDLRVVVLHVHMPAAKQEGR